MRLRPATPIALILSLLVCCGATSGSCNNSNGGLGFGPSKGEIIGAVAGVAGVVVVTVIAVHEVKKSHHTLQGCVFSTPTGLELRTTDNKTFALSGTMADITPGNTLRLHGDRQKHDKNATGDQVFLVQKMQKNYGPCQALAQSTPAAPPATQP